MAKKSNTDTELQTVGAERQRERGYTGEVDYSPCADALTKRNAAAAKVDAARAAQAECTAKLGDAEKAVAAAQAAYDHSTELGDFTKLESEKLVVKFRADVATKADAALAKAETTLAEATDALTKALDAIILDAALAKIDPKARHAFEERIIQAKLAHFTALADLQNEIATRYKVESADQAEAVRLADIIDPAKRPVAAVSVGDAIHARLAFLRDELGLTPYLAPVPPEYRLVARDANDPDQINAHVVEIDGAQMAIIDHANLPRVIQERREALEKAQEIKQAEQKEEERKKVLSAPLGLRLRALDQENMHRRRAAEWSDTVASQWRAKYSQADRDYARKAQTIAEKAKRWFLGDSPEACEIRSLDARIREIWDGKPYVAEPHGESLDAALERFLRSDVDLTEKKLVPRKVGPTDDELHQQKYDALHAGGRTVSREN